MPNVARAYRALGVHTELYCSPNCCRSCLCLIIPVLTLLTLPLYPVSSPLPCVFVRLYVFVLVFKSAPQSMSVSLPDCAQCSCVYNPICWPLCRNTESGVVHMHVQRVKRFGLGNHIWFGDICCRHGGVCLVNLMSEPVARNYKDASSFHVCNLDLMCLDLHILTHISWASRRQHQVYLIPLLSCLMEVVVTVFGL